ncbi:glutactin-like [Bradysia coprophila]|uniref:glutactin-like n=1 Tax=Bradysia coprophila TaxID=38358 RepID=UPI00187D8763|nr:glutactin-like [Bradysia coprophila]
MTEEERRATDLEDCLNMAIYSPNLSGKLPVMVYVHGGSFYLTNANEFPPNYLLERDVVLVVVQYRLDALGFLATNSEDIPGNAALMDVQQALTFVKENIDRFGGNPNSVTLFGQSAGAAMVSALVISPAVPQNLFHRVIIQSGSVFSKWSVSTDPIKDARDIAEAAGLDSKESISHLNEAFIKMDVFSLLQAVDRYQSNLQAGPLHLGARSLSIGGPNNLLPDLPQKIVSAPQYKKNYPMIIGTTKDDGSYVATVLYDFLIASMQASGSTNPNVPIMTVILQLLCTFLDAGDKCDAIRNIISGTFWTEEELASHDIATIAPGLIDLLGTFLFKGPALQAALSNAGFDRKNTFFYTFDYQGEKTRFGYEQDTSHYPFKGGVTHSDDLIYLFPYPSQVTPLNQADTQMAKKLIDMWTSFATNSSPPSLENGSGGKFSWPPMITGTFGPYVRIDKEFTIGTDYTTEFVSNVTGKSNTDYRQLMAMLSA